MSLVGCVVVSSALGVCIADGRYPSFAASVLGVMCCPWRYLTLRIVVDGIRLEPPSLAFVVGEFESLLSVGPHLSSSSHWVGTHLPSSSSAGCVGLHLPSSSGWVGSHLPSSLVGLEGGVDCHCC